MKKRFFLWFLLSVSAVPVGAFPVFGVDTVESVFFRDCWHQGDLVHWLDNAAPFAVGLSETTGRWHLPDAAVFSVEGNPARQNRFYMDGFRINSLLQEGSSVFRPDMTRHSLATDTRQSRLFFWSDSVQPDFVSLTGIAGGIGGVNPSSRYLINVLHKSARERFYLLTDLSQPDDGRSTGLNPEDYRPHILGSGQMEAQYSVPSKAGRRYRQHLYADFGWRTLPSFNEGGVCGRYTDSWYKVQADGEIPVRHNPHDPSLRYMFNVSQRDAMGSEFWFNPDEVVRNGNYSGALYLCSQNDSSVVTRWTAGVMWETNTLKHNNLEFTRNLVDQDGEGFEPFMPDGQVHALTAASTLEHSFLSWLHLEYDGANSFLYFAPERNTWSNRICWNSMFGTERYDLYTVNWQARAFAAGLLDNTLGLRADWKPLRWLSLQAKADFTLDGVLLGGGKSFVRPNWQAQLTIAFSPCPWFQASLSAGDYRMAFTMDHVRFFSNDWLNGTMCYSDGTVFGTTGGAFHQMGEGQWQPRFLVVAAPFRFVFGRHEISVLSSYRKFHDQWTVAFDGTAEDYGFYVPSAVGLPGVEQVFFFRPGERRYVTASMPAMGGNIFCNTPFYASNLVQYAYSGKKVYVSLSWQSFIMTSLSALGNGVLANDVNVLSESLANPNTALVSTNAGTYAWVGRANQDRAYIARFRVAYNITKNWRIGLTFKFKDGQPFSNFTYQFLTDDEGRTQVAVWNRRSRGINPTDGNFGSRKDGFYNFDANAEYRAFFRNGSMLSVQLQGFNLYDFGNELTEFTFEEGGASHRYAMSLSIPRTLLLSLRYDF
jgi:hypothetical protein